MAADREQPPDWAAPQDPAAAGRGDRSGEALARSRELRARSQRLLARSQHLTRAHAAESGPPRRADPAEGPPLAGQQPRRFTRDLEEQVEQARTTRARLAALAADLVATEETVAYLHDQLAARDPRNAARYRRAAEEARRAVRRIRDYQRNAAGAGPG
jgi:hypothetical protein